jgi:GMP synthase (glutamine-hydrolysing)
LIPEAARQQAKDIAGQFGLSAEVLPVRSVGVQGDARTYAHPAVLSGLVPRAAEDWHRLEQVSTRLTNSIPAVNRVVFLCWPDALPRLRLRPRYLERPRLDLLRLADDMTMAAVEEDGLMDAIFQFPTILVPLGCTAGGESVALRPLESTDVMTASFAQLPRRTLDKIVERIRALPRVEAIIYDITHKPPATMEWE